MTRMFIVLAIASLGACGKGKTPADAAGACSDKEKAYAYDLNDADGEDDVAPCAKAGKADFSGNVHLDTTEDGVKVTVRATDDDVVEGAPGSDVNGRDAVVVHANARDPKGVEVPLVKTKTGYTGAKVIPYSDLEKLTDEGTKLEVSFYDHDTADKQRPAEELKVAIAVSTGKSCEKAIAENPQTMDMGKKSGPDLTDEQLGRPMKSSAFIQKCGLPDSSSADICVALKKGKPLGVTVRTTPMDNKVAACIDHATRQLGFPSNEKLDVVKQHF